MVVSPTLFDNKEYGMLIIPLWTSAPWWPLITRDGRHPDSFVLNWLDIPQKADKFIPSKPGTCIFSERLNYHVLALKVSFTSSLYQFSPPSFPYLLNPILVISDWPDFSGSTTVQSCSSWRPSGQHPLILIATRVQT